MILSKLLWLFRVLEERLSENVYQHGRYLTGQEKARGH